MDLRTLSAVFSVALLASAACAEPAAQQSASPISTPVAQATPTATPAPTPTATPTRIPTTVSVSPSFARLYTGSATAYGSSSQQFTATVKDQAGQAMPAESVTWSAGSSGPGGISSTGRRDAFEFTATGGGDATITITAAGHDSAAAGGASATARIFISPPAGETVVTGGLTFSVSYAQSGADVYTQVGISSDDASRITAAADADGRHVKEVFARAFGERPAVYVFLDAPALTLGLETVFGARSEIAKLHGPKMTGDSVRGPLRSGVALQWAKARSQSPLFSLRHELAHQLLREVVGPSARVPAWLNEGMARLEDLTLGPLWRVTLARYGAASMSATGRLFTTAQLDPVATWASRSGDAFDYQYSQSSQMVQLLKDDLGTTGVLRIFTDMGAGRSFSAAYSAVAGRPFEAFAAEYPKRIAAIAPAYPGIATVPGGKFGGVLTVVFYGFTPEASVTYTLAGPVKGTGSVPVNVYGVAPLFLPASWPPGTYRISASGANGTAMTTAVIPPRQ